MSFHEAVGGWVSLMFWWNCTMKIHRTRKGPICQKWRNWCWVMYLMNDPASIDTHYDTWDELTFTTYLSTNICRAWNKHKTRMCRTNRPFCLFFSLHIINGAPATPFLYPGSTQKHHGCQSLITHSSEDSSTQVFANLCQIPKLKPKKCWRRRKSTSGQILRSNTHFFIGNSIFHLSLELLTKFWKTSLKVA